MKSKKDAKVKFDINDYNKSIVPIDMGPKCLEYGKNFALNTLILRQVPWMPSGLKIVETRILYMMYISKWTGKNLIKVSKAATETMGIHPHGDTAIQQTIYRMSQDWNNNCSYVYVDGNNGDVEGSEPAAGRYAQCALTDYAVKCFFEDFDQDVLTMVPTYSGDMLEPEYILPSRYPNLLVNHSFTVAPGLNAEIYPCNFNEVCESVLKLMENPKQDIILYPDIPSGASVIDDGQFADLCITGGGENSNYRMRADIEVDEKNHRLIVKSTPLFVTWNSILEKLTAKIKAGELNEIDRSNPYESHSTDNELEAYIFYNKNADPYKLLQKLFTKNLLQTTRHVEFKLVDNFNLRHFSMSDILLYWLDSRRDYIRRITNHKLIQKQERRHVLTTLLYVLDGDNMYKTVDIIKKANNKAEAAESLMKEYDISSLQAKNICSMPLSDLNKEAVKKYKEEYAKLKPLIKELEELSVSSKKIDKKIAEQLKEGMELFGRPRRSKIININNEQLVKKSKHTLVFTKNGFIKKLPENATSIGTLKEGDYPVDVMKVDNALSLLLFDDLGRISKLLVSDVPGCDMKSNGHPIKNVCSGINGSTVTVKLLPNEAQMTKLKDKLDVLFITKSGLAKKTKLFQYITSKKDIQGIGLKNDDKVVSVKFIDRKCDVLVYTNKGNALRIKATDIKETNRIAFGGQLVKMADDEYCIGCDIIEKTNRGIFILTSRGNAKLCDLEGLEYSKKSIPTRVIRLDDEKEEEIACIKTVDGNEKFGIFMKDSVQKINVADLFPMATKIARGKKMVPVRKGEVIITVKKMEE